jgi:hypothetical protein
VEEASRPRRWYSPAPARQLEPISTRRAYTEVLLVFAAFFLASVAAAVFLLAGRPDNTLKNASWSIYIPGSIDQLAAIGLAGTVVWLLSERRAVGRADLASLPRHPAGGLDRAALLRIAAWAFAAEVAGAVVNVALQTGHLPTRTPNAPELTFAFFESLNAGFVEELVVLAFVVVTLRQGRRPMWEIVVVALVLRGSYHIYYGPGVLGILLWAALFLWIYLRTRALLVLMVCHTLWDLSGFYSQRWPAVSAAGSLLLALLFIAAPITWLTERSKTVPLPAPAWPAPGPSEAQNRSFPDSDVTLRGDGSGNKSGAGATGSDDPSGQRRDGALRPEQE